MSWGCSSAGRAPRSQRGGQRFDPAQLHQTLRFTLFPNFDPRIIASNRADRLPLSHPPASNSSILRKRIHVPTLECDLIDPLPNPQTHAPIAPAWHTLVLVAVIVALSIH